MNDHLPLQAPNPDCLHRIGGKDGRKGRACILINELKEGYALQQVICDASGHVVDLLTLEVNSSWERRTGLRAKDVVGKRASELVQALDPELLKIYERVAVGGEEINLPAFHCISNQDHSASLRSLGGGFCFLLLHDEACLEHSQNHEALLLAAVEQSPLSIVITDENGSIEYTNHYFLELTGYTKEELQGKNPRILQSNHTPKSLYKDLWDTLLQEKTWRGHFCNQKKTGECYWESACISPIHLADNTLHYLGVKEDITEKRRLQDTNDKLRRMSELSQDLMFILDRFGRSVYTNPAFDAIIVAPPTTCLWRHVPVQDRLSLRNTVRDAIRHTGSWRGTVELLGEEGAKKTFAGSLIHIPSQESHGFITGIFRDITAEKALERYLRNIEKMDAMGTLARGIAHDFNNLLTSILNAAELAGREVPNDSPILSKLKVIVQVGLRAREMNRCLLSFSQTSQDRRIPFDLSAIMRESAMLLEGTVQKGIEIRTNIASSIWIHGDPIQIQQMIMNIAINAYQAMKSEGVLELGVSEFNRKAVITLQDTGEGMDSLIRSKAFEPFFTTRSEEGQRGLGLSVAHNIAIQHGGDIRLESEKGKGTLVHIELPCSADEYPNVPETVEDENLGYGHVLLLDLAELQAALTKEALQILGYRVTSRTEPFIALDSFRDHPAIFDLVVVAYSKGTLSGEDFARKIKAIRPEIPILLCSGVEPPTLEDSPFDRFLAKPFTISELGQSLAKLRRQCNNPMAPLQTQARSEKELRQMKAQAHEILLVEDSPMTLALLRSWLSCAGYRIRSARDGQEAWEIISDQGIDAFSMVLSDIVMPRMNGLHLVERIREMDSDIPVVFLSTSNDSKAMKAALHLHVDEFLSKPFTSEELLECVKRQKLKIGTKKRTHETALAVRMAQRALTALPEKDLPLYSVHHSLTDAGGDVFRCFKQSDGSILFFLADVAGHSVISSYAVAAFLGLLSSMVGEIHALRDLILKLNKGIQDGPFSEVPVCALLGRWHPVFGRLHLINAGLPHGVLGSCMEPAPLHPEEDNNGFISRRIPINGTPLGVFDEPMVEEKVLFLFPGDRVFFATDGFFDTHDLDGQTMESIAAPLWTDLHATPIQDAVSILAGGVQAVTDNALEDDLLLVAFEQSPLRPDLLRFTIPSLPEAIDDAVIKLGAFLDKVPRSIPLTHSRRFDILLAAREGMTNAMQHGNKGKQEANIAIMARWETHPPALILAILDEGDGFSLDTLPPLLDPFSDRGRGIPFLRHAASRVEITGGELEVTFAWET